MGKAGFGTASTVLEQNPLLSKHGASDSPEGSWYHAGNPFVRSTGPTADNAAWDVDTRTGSNKSTVATNTILNLVLMAHPPPLCNGAGTKKPLIGPLPAPAIKFFHALWRKLQVTTPAWSDGQCPAGTLTVSSSSTRSNIRYEGRSLLCIRNRAAGDCIPHLINYRGHFSFQRIRS